MSAYRAKVRDVTRHLLEAKVSRHEDQSPLDRTSSAH